MFSKFVDAFKNKDVRGRILFTLVILFIYVIGLLITVPGVDPINVGDAVGENDLLGIMNLLSGGALDTFSIFALGVSPYITASIIIQLLQLGVLPKLQELSEQGEAGKRKINDITRYVGLLLGAVQAYGIILTLDNQNAFDFSGMGMAKWVSYVYVIAILLAGAMFVMWLSDQITTKGIGNGVSMIIFAGIVKSIPNNYSMVYEVLTNATAAGAEYFNGLLKFLAYVLYTLVLIIFVVFIESSTRKIPIQQSKATLSQANSNNMNFLPIKLNNSEVIPVIFAQAVLTAPVTILGFIDSSSETYENFQKIFSLTETVNGWPVALIIYIALIVVFSFMYAHIQIDPEKLSENLTKQGSYIPGIRSGSETRSYLSKVLNRVTFMGAWALALIATLPVVIPMIFPQLTGTTFGGTGLIICVGVALETTKQIQGYVAEKNYKTFNF